MSGDETQLGNTDLRKRLEDARARVTELEDALAAAEGRASLLRRELATSERVTDEGVRNVERLAKDLRAARTRIRRLEGTRGVRAMVVMLAIVRPFLRSIRAFRAALAKRRPHPGAERAQAHLVAAVRAQRPDPGPASGPPVSIVVLTRNGKHHMERLLDGLERRTAYRSFELIVIDNASDDGTTELLAENRSFPVRVLRNEENVSFSAGNNQGVAAARGEVILFMNNDVDPINEGWLSAMLGTLQATPACAAVGALLIYPARGSIDLRGDRTFDDLTVQHRGIGFTFAERAPRARNLGGGESPLAPGLTGTRPMPAVTAACMLVDRDKLRAVGGMSEEYFYGTEDVDLCLKLRAAGGEIVLCGGAALFHHEFGTQSTVEAPEKAANRKRNWQLFADRWAAPLTRSVRLDQLDGEGRWTGIPGRTVAITLSDNDPDAGWGDWFTAHELGDAMAAKGWNVVYAEARRDAWYQLDGDVDLVIALLDKFDPRRAPGSASTMAWVRNWTDRWIARPWFDDYDMVVASSERSAQLIRESSRHEPAVLPLAVDPARFAPRSPDAELACDYTFTGSNWGGGRALVSALDVRAGERFALYGKGWEDDAGAAPYRRGFLPYARLPELYSSAKVVLDDTAEHTLPYAAVNARVFEALGSGTLVISNNVAGSRELFDGELPTFTTREELRAQLDRFLGDDDLRARTVAKLRARVLEHHTYPIRARQFVEFAREAVARPKLAMKIAPRDAGQAESWGDTHFARDFSRGLRKLGFDTRIDLRADWDLPSRQDADIVIQLRGLHIYAPKPGHLNVLWVISHPDDVGGEECERFDVVMVASHAFARDLADGTDARVHVLLQATDVERFRPVPADPALRSDVLFVGNSRKQRRPAVIWAVELGVPIAVYGADWESFIPPEHLRATYFPNERLQELYCSAEIVLSDHWPDMSKNGFISNRIFDALACGAFVLSDEVASLEEVFGDLVPVFRSKDELGELIERYIGDSAERKRLAEAGMRVVRDSHSFDARARDFARIVEPLLAVRARTIEEMAARATGS